MREAENPRTERIYVRLLNEGTDVWRPTTGRAITPGTFEVLPTSDYATASEEWEFTPGTHVLCTWRRLSDGPALVAVRPAPERDREESMLLAEDVARRAGVSVTARGGLRLVSASDAEAFVATCERNGITIWGIEAFRDEGGDLVEVRVPGRYFTDSEYRHSVPATPGRMEPALAFLRNASPSAVWFDFLLGDPRANSYRYGCPSGHVPPLPAPNSRLTLVESPDVLDLRAALDKRRYGGDVHVAEIRTDGIVEDPRKLLRDLAVLALGEHLERWISVAPVDQLWRPIPRTEAEACLRRVLACDLAHEVPDMDEADARHIVDRFLGRFATDALFHTIHDISSDGFPGSGHHLTAATFEGTIGVSDERHVGILMVFGDD